MYANRYVAGTGWAGALLIENGDTGNVEYHQYPQIAFDGSGNAMAVWDQYDNPDDIDTHYNIYANRYVEGTGWAGALLIENDDAGDAEHPQIAFDSSGNAMAVWYQDDGTYDSIYANRFE